MDRKRNTIKTTKRRNKMETKTMATREEIIKGLKQFIPDLEVYKSEECKHRVCREGGLVIASHGNPRPMYKGIYAFDYDEEVDYLHREAMIEFDSKYKFESSYEFGVHKEINQWIGSQGWIAEWWDTAFLEIWSME
jgi:hypothetical protein